MPEICVLDNLLINKIAAGEVIERPASIVKELVENSIDAGATSITVEIKNGGIDFIKIIDDGSGINENEAETAFMRHATSKLKAYDDLESILTLGFRGEALASIAAVSQLELITKTADSDMGVRLEIHGGKLISSGQCAAKTGTIMTIRNVFYNTPARRKFLKKPSTEAAYISEMVNRLALGHPNISFKYINNNNYILNAVGDKDLRTTALFVFGRETARNMLEVQGSSQLYSIKGLIAKPIVSKANRSCEYFFINGRYIKSPVIQRAVEEAYEGRLMVGKFPVFVLDLIPPANSVDINVHPAKLEVRFSDEDFIFEFVKATVKKVLEGTNLIPNISLYDVNKKKAEAEETATETDAKTTEQPAAEESDYRQKLEAMLLEEDETEEYNENDGDFIYDFDSSRSMLKICEEIKDEMRLNAVQKLLKSADIEENDSLGKMLAKNDIDYVKNNVFKNYKIIGQIFSTYWIIECSGSIYIIDQHAAHERILYEKFCKEFKSEEIVSQKLLQPVMLMVNEREKEVIQDNIDLLNKFGFELEDFGRESYALSAAPYIFKSPVTPDFFMSIIELLSEKKIENVYDTLLDNIATMSCKAAVKGNDSLSFFEARALIEKSLTLENPFSCPHGRPTIIEITKYEIEKMFKRIQN